MITSAALSLLKLSYVTNIVLCGMEGCNIIVKRPALSLLVAFLLLWSVVETEEEGGFVVWMVVDHFGYHRLIFLSLLGMEGGGGSVQILPIV